MRPAAVREAGRGSDVVHAARPRGVVSLVVLRAERLEPEVVRDKAIGDGEVWRYERF
jgi:hypothetical protein